MNFHALHHGESPLFLPNAWDYASAAMLAAQGFPAIGTTSLGVAAAAGLPDGTGATREETVALARRLCRLPCLISVDLEGGFSEDPGVVAAVAKELAELGVAGVNLEDGRADGSLTAVGHHQEVVAAVKSSAPGLFVNARTDTHWLKPAGIEPDREALSRARSYVDAGADGVFVPGMTEEASITALVAAVEAPVNILFSPNGPTYARLGELGVRRVSCGSLLFRAALDAAMSTARAVAEGRPVASDILSYAQVQALS